MSGTLILKNGLLAAACVAGLTLTACASGQSSSSRYGDVYDYESGGNSCYGAACGAVAQEYTAPTAYTGTIGGQAISPGVVYTDCSLVSGMNCNQQQTVEIYSPPVTTGVICPSGTTTAGDGTCMQAADTYAYTSTATSYAGETADCPVGTTAAGDGTCMQSGSSYDYASTSSSSTSTYTGSTYSTGVIDCPAGTSATGNGTCMETTSGYTPPVTYIPPTTYLPIRK